MGYALIWAESLAVALIGLALATAWSARGRWIRVVWSIVVFAVVAGLVAIIVALAYHVQADVGEFVRTSWFAFSLSWLAAFLILGVSVLRRGLRRSSESQARPAASWCRWRLWSGFGGALLALAFTFWNLDLGVRADLAIGRQEAGAMLLTMNPIPVADSENAARVYAEAATELGDEVKNPWLDAARLGLDSESPVDWRSEYVVNLVKKHEAALALLRKGAAMKRCRFDQPRTLLDAVAQPEPSLQRIHRTGTALLAIDARLKATQGDLPQAFEDINAILGIVRHLSERYGLYSPMETTAWRTLEDVLRLAPQSKDPLPYLASDDLMPLVRMTREEHALLGMIFPAIASQPSTIMEEAKKKNSSWDIFAIETVCIPLARVFLVPDELDVMRKLIDDYRNSPESTRNESPNDWAALREAVRSDKASALGAYFIKPKQRKILQSFSELAALRQTSRTGFAIESFHRKYGKYPERLEQLVPEFLSAVPVDPRDGQPLHIKQTKEMIVIYTPDDRAAVDRGELKFISNGRSAPIFRLVTTK